jgi:phytanoyl-CoA hydroxylase
LIEDIVTPGIAIYSVKLIAKPPRTDVVCHWHQDDAYYTKLSESKARMSVWVPLQAAHERNGCLWIVPRSHRWGLREHRTKESGQCRLSMTSPTLGWCTDKSGSKPSTSRRRGP